MVIIKFIWLNKVLIRHSETFPFWIGCLLQFLQRTQRSSYLYGTLTVMQICLQNNEKQSFSKFIALFLLQRTSNGPSLLPWKQIFQFDLAAFYFDPKFGRNCPFWPLKCMKNGLVFIKYSPPHSRHLYILFHNICQWLSEARKVGWICETNRETTKKVVFFLSHFRSFKYEKKKKKKKKNAVK